MPGRWRGFPLPAAAGLAATALVAVGTVGLSYTGFGTTRADSTLWSRWIGRGALAVGLPLMTLAWWLARRVEARWQWGLLGTWALPLLLVPPVLSRDMYAYAEQGFLVLQGLDPYTVAMGGRGGPFADLVDVFWQGSTTVYPPGALEVQRLVVEATGVHAYWSVIAMRIPAVAGLGLMAWAAARVATALGNDAGSARWAVLLNPLAVVHVVGGGHNDALAAGLAAVAVVVSHPRTNGGRPWGWLVGCALAGVAATVKQPVALVVVAAAALAVPGGISGVRRWRDLASRVAIGVLLAGAAFVLVTTATGLGYGWLTGSGKPNAVKTLAPASLLADLIAQARLGSFADAVRVTGPLVLAIGVVALGGWAWRTLPHPDGALRFIAGAFLIVVVAFPGFQAWYLLWGAPYAAALGWFDRHRRAVLAVVTWCFVGAWCAEATGIPPLLSAGVATLAAGVVLVALPRAGARSG